MQERICKAPKPSKTELSENSHLRKAAIIIRYICICTGMLLQYKHDTQCNNGAMMSNLMPVTNVIAIKLAAKMSDL